MAVADRLRAPSAPAVRAHCDLDNWDFDPTLTDGVCPICGWRPPVKMPAPSALAAAASRVPWDLVFLGVLAVVLLVLAVIVGLAAHVNLLPGNSH